VCFKTLLFSIHQVVYQNRKDPSLQLPLAQECHQIQDFCYRIFIHAQDPISNFDLVMNTRSWQYHEGDNAGPTLIILVVQILKLRGGATIIFNYLSS
jgi:hypothetical protein